MVAKTVPDALAIPAVALLTSPEGKTTVMVAGSDGRAHEREVKVGIKQDDKVQVVEGLQPGENVVTTGAYGLPDKTKIKVESPEKPEGAASGHEKKSGGDDEK
jgi:multidrug efflux pump subunit AcrA (membrane-fusion protein)